MTVKLSARALRDVETRVQYLLRQSLEAAEDFIAQLDASFAHLLAHPRAGRTLHLKGRRAPVRRWNIPPMFILYDLRDDVLYVVRVRHGARRSLAVQR